MFGHFVAAGLVVASPADAEPWDFSSTIDLGVVYSDNIFLAEDNLAQGDLAFFVAPEFALTRDAERIDANLRYRPEAYFYRTNSDADSIYHVAEANMTSAIVHDKFFLYLGGSQYQSHVSPTAQVPTSNIPLSLNRVDAIVLEARPYWEQRIGTVDLLLEASYIDNEYDDDALQGNVIRRGTFVLDNTEREEGLVWGVDYEYLRADYDISPEFVYQRAAGTVGYWIKRDLRIFGAGGAETPLDDRTVTRLDEEFWEAGFQYRPNQRVDLEVAGGRRFFGNSYRMNLDYRFRRGEMTLHYDETPATGAQIMLDRQPITETDNIDGILDEPGRSDRFLRRLAEWTTKIELSKSEFLLRAMAESREQRIDSDGTPLADEQLAGIAARWSWAVGTNTGVALQAERSRRDDDGGIDDYTLLLAALSYSFSERISMIVQFQHARQEDRETNISDYSENQYGLFFQFTL